MNNLTSNFTNAYNPAKAIVIFKSENDNESYYTESFDFDANGKMINAHPLNWNESKALGEILAQDHDKRDHCFQSRELIPPSVLHLKTGTNGFVVWHTPAMCRELLFVDELNLPKTKYPLPAMVWIADQEKLSVFAIKTTGRPGLDTPVYKAPFFNIYTSGVVCMGTVDIDFDFDTYLEDFIEAWQNYFFNSKFSHLLEDRTPVKSNFMQFCKRIAGGKRFPVSELIKNNKKLKQLLHGHQ